MKNPCVSCPVSLIYDTPVFPLWSKKTVYSNNALVYYKVNSLPSCGVGSVRNARVIGRRT